ncbi:MAG TPA: hypothetical protein VNJ51_07400 [Candidatus Dormibacteraeota bacterium]|nr:hypothetical protein [Candidatus Dormibacteraeota bacterium]
MAQEKIGLWESGGWARTWPAACATLARVIALAEATKRQYDVMVALGRGDIDTSGIAELTFRGRRTTTRA